ncbi:MAG TPA: 50S ribosomal protein L24 [Candidatus Sumerlaeota bacterium]|nr:MAG: 50S ribosomal protein L24 [candidate division BRC1 bacterium ADurb.Bin183]HOE64705.1 50S ribosomal protein L24 [Candidatus Sumerlaeota bacterium]HRR31607.1 50S ribosomal protein L24 [Candidatus Sumerlaeia bacterium]HON51422.1 50S ribosomal protein L24 [Candidatus Sumerlaeota bacterium]HOR64525.1 50S ribosomal protein L24 [Candidatus Sumerlaeota bacterium]
MSFRIRKEDRVLVISGKSQDKGKAGKVLRVYPSTDKAIVENINFITQHKRTRDPQKPGGRITREAPVHLSKLMLICPKCNQPTRVGAKVVEDKTRVRVCKKCGADI